jgi:xanthine dehydrogenase molybdopterin-binding subunit B
VLQAVHAQAEELQAEVLKLEQKVAAGNMLVNTMTSEKESLESFMEKATTCRLLEFETLRTCCKALEAQVSVRQPTCSDTMTSWCTVQHQGQQQAWLSKQTGAAYAGADSRADWMLHHMYNQGRHACTFISACRTVCHMFL